MALPGRKRGAFEAPFHGYPRERPSTAIGIIDGVNPDDRTVDVSYLGMSGGAERVDIWADDGGFSLPKPGTMVMLVFDDRLRPHVMGYREIGWKNRMGTGQVPPISHGEKVYQSKEFGQRMYFRSDGVLEIMAAGEEGIEIKPTRRLRAYSSQLVELFANTSRMALGVVRRATGLAPTLDEDTVIPDPTQGGQPHREFNVDVAFAPGPPPLSATGRAFRIVGGTGVIDDMGKPEISSSGFPLRFVLEILANAGGGSVPLSSFTMDAGGNINISAQLEAQINAVLVSITAARVEVKAANIVLGLLPQDVALFANRFLTLYAMHFHPAPQAPAGVLPTGTPIPPIPSPLVTSQIVQLG